MKSELLDNPIWSALHTTHAHFAQGGGALRRYPADVAPFAAVASDGPIGAAELHCLREPGEAAYFVGALPVVPAPWISVPGSDLFQMICTRVPVHSAQPVQFRELGEADDEAMLALTRLVFPGFFRRNTARMGRYFGIFSGPELVAMGGERLAMEGFQEISGICTHPSSLGRGYASVLVSHLVESILERGATPFLHVSSDNHRAVGLYRALGFSEHARVRITHVSRPVEEGEI